MQKNPHVLLFILVNNVIRKPTCFVVIADDLTRCGVDAMLGILSLVSIARPRFCKKSTLYSTLVVTIHMMDIEFFEFFGFFFAKNSCTELPRFPQNTKTTRG
jgi:hypothetical protein